LTSLITKQRKPSSDPVSVVNVVRQHYDLADAAHDEYRDLVLAKCRISQMRHERSVS
jgi:hypothetical protein